MMIKAFIIFVKAFLLLLYLACFGHYFVRPALERYLRKDTMMMMREEYHPEGLDPPAITLCVNSGGVDSGF